MNEPNRILAESDCVIESYVFIQNFSNGPLRLWFSIKFACLKLWMGLTSSHN